MFKHDDNTLDKLAHQLNAADFARLHLFFQSLQDNSMATIPEEEIERAFQGFQKIYQRQLDGKYYAFDVYDTYAESRDEGVELFLRLGNKIQTKVQYDTRDQVTQIEDVLKFTKKYQVNEIFTGHIPQDGFLGLLREQDEEHPIYYHPLSDYQMAEFESEGIKITYLPKLL